MTNHQEAEALADELVRESGPADFDVGDVIG
jgi:hypothetical protein